MLFKSKVDKILSSIENILEEQFSKESRCLQDIAKSYKANEILAYKATSNPDTLHYDKVIRAYSRLYFKIATNKKN